MTTKKILRSSRGINISGKDYHISLWNRWILSLLLLIFLSMLNNRYYNLHYFVEAIPATTKSSLPNSSTRSGGSTSTTNLPNNYNDNIHAMIVSSSRYWFNYRHANNALGVYEVLRQNGIPDEKIILMVADEYAVNARNPFKNRMFANGIRRPSWYSKDTELDYRGSDVTVQMFIDALMGHAPKSLHSNFDSNLLIYVTGHGGDQFFKFQDEEELTAQDIARLMDKLYEEKKFRQALVIADTCQAFTLFDKITTPNVLALGTSLKGENAYAHHSDNDLGLAVIERWTHSFLANYNDRYVPSHTLQDLMVSPFSNKQVLGAHVGIKEDTSTQKFKDIKISEFFGPKGGGPKMTTASDNSNGAPPVKFVEAIPDASSSTILPRELNPKSSSALLPVKSTEDSTTEVEQDTDDVCSSNESLLGYNLTADSTFFFLFVALFGVLLVSMKLERILV